MCLAIPGKVISIAAENGILIGRVDFGGVIQPVSLDFVPEVSPGEYVMVHVGFAISRVNAQEAEETYRTLKQMGLLEDELPFEEARERDEIPR